MTFGIVSVPAATYLSERFKMPGLLLLMPALVLTVALMYLAENHALMRCGRFIRATIEKHFEGVPGWEAWLESADERRSVDRYLAYGFFLLFLVYYVGSVAMCINYMTEQRYAAIATSSVAASYIAVGIYCVGYLVLNLRTTAVLSTDTRD